MGVTKTQRHNALVLVIALAPVIATAQQFLPATPGPPQDPNARYEVVAIKAVNGASGQMMMRMLPGRLDYNGMPIGILLRQALQKPDYQIVGAPGWVNTERYSITATAPEGTPPTAITVMMVNLLKDRFHLTSHLETREQPIFNLVIARSDGRLGPDLKPTPAECQATIAERIAASKAAAERGAPPPPPTSFPDPNDPLACGFVRMGPGLATGSGRTIAQIAPTLADLLGRPVIDKTGLTGRYDFALTFAPTGRGAGPFAMLPGAPPPPDDPDAPGLSTAVQEQLGLRLESARGPVEVVVIDSLEKPTLD
jgi:uncharacterized protein (TIGR03435 family)